MFSTHCVLCATYQGLTHRKLQDLLAPRQPLGEDGPLAQSTEDPDDGQLSCHAERGEVGYLARRASAIRAGPRAAEEEEDRKRRTTYLVRASRLSVLTEILE